MSDLKLTLSREQSDFLRVVLQKELEKTRVEYRHTDTPSYREVVKDEEQLLRGILQALADAQATAA